MDFYNSVKKFLGLPVQKAPESSIEKRNDAPCCTPHNEDYEKFGFNIFSNPVEMHQYFERQMNEIMKSFGMFSGDGPFSGNADDEFFGGFKDPSFKGPFSFGFSEFPNEKELQHHDEPQEGNLRDRFLKRGYQTPRRNPQENTDSDLDKEFKADDLDRMLVPKVPQQPQRNFFFGRSMSSRTIRNSDGTYETHKTVTDQDGNQEVTITRKQGDKEYTIVTKTDKNGVAEVTENFVNLDESQKDSFLKNDAPKPILDTDVDDSLFSKFF
ncbi:hypothetical protein PPYR_08958 [Photinus pyralis]|uniref:HCLS1-associated protein X-1 n=1 Tax=Photinus pyralis TaxID=7054 RepID=A0A1Y1MRD1_PHOPY|nr:uncharacterized protein LOC116172821 [Photinus pyralis]KAB0797965.1 hypothetical protein PPYR_08958 [Photinus pyralis]